MDQIQQDIEVVRAAYERFLPPVEEVREVSVVRVFRDRREYEDYIPEDMKWSSGVWMPTKKELVISPIDLGSARKNQERLLAVVYHEAFHQYLFYALGRMQPPVWWDEGHAALFEGSDLDAHRRTVSIGETDRAGHLEALLKRGRVDFPAFFVMTHQDFYGGNLKENYALAWGIVYFLRKAAPQYPKGGYERLLGQTIAGLKAANGDWNQAAAAGLKGVDLAQFARDFADFWDGKSKRSRAERFDVLGE